MNGHGGKRPGAGRPPQIDLMKQIHIGMWCENRRRKLRDETAKERKLGGSVLVQTLEREQVEIDRREHDRNDPIDRASAAAERQAAADRIIGNRKVFGKNPRYFSSHRKPQLKRTTTEGLVARESLVDTVYRECREEFEPALKLELGAEFQLTDERIKSCERRYREEIRQRDD